MKKIFNQIFSPRRFLERGLYGDNISILARMPRGRLWIAALVFLSFLQPHSLAFLVGQVNAHLSEISAIEAELETLPKTPANATPWTIGYAAVRNEQERPEIIEIHFPETAPIDLVVLMPATYKTDANTLRPLGFPIRFMIELLLPDGSTDVIADFRDIDYSISGTGPQTFDCPDIRLATGIRITVTRMNVHSMWWMHPYAIAMSEVLAFSDKKNVALNSKVKAQNPKEFGYIWSPAALVDGFSLYSHVDRNVRDPFHDFHTFSDKVVLDYDLGKSCLVDELRLWPVVYCTQENFPPASGTSFPTDILLEVLDSPNGSDNPKMIYQSGETLPRPGSNPFMRRLNPVEGRYFRLTLSKPLPDFRIDRDQRISLSEVELFGNGEVLTRGNLAKVSVHGKREEHFHNIMPAPLTDGQTNEGEILPLRKWIGQFKRREELEQRRATLQLDLAIARHQERERFISITYASIALITVLILMVWLIRLLSQKRWSRIREQIACDLHDDVGANMSSIAHSVELVRERIANPTSQQTRLLDNAIRTARATAQRTRQIVRFLEQKQLGGSMSIQIEKMANLILGDIECSCLFDKSQPFHHLTATRKWDILLYVKEALNNVVKHAEATRVEIITRSDGSMTQLIITDNGQGILEPNQRPYHLEHRAKRLKGSLTVDSSPAQGTQITLTLGKSR